MWRHDLDADGDIDDRLGPLVLTHTVPLPLSMRLDKPAGGDLLASTDSFLGLVHTLWMFLGMEITSAERAPVSRQWRRQMQRRALKLSDIRVVLLRRIAHSSGEEAGRRLTDWQHRWPVQGHYRHIRAPEGFAEHHGQAHVSGDEVACTTCAGRLAWVRPYIKGPDGKPLKVSRTLMKLAR